MDDTKNLSQNDIRGRRAINVSLKLGAVAGLVLLLWILWLPTQQSVRSGRRDSSRNNLKQIGLAFHNYHEQYTTFPDEAAGHSWETHLLPYLDSAPTYDAMDLSKPWHDPTNESAAKQTIQSLTNPKYQEQFDSRGYGLSHYAGNSNWLKPGSVIDLPGVTDGIANTILAGEIGDGFRPWAQPGNLRDPSLGFNTGSGSFGHPRREGGVLFLMGDGRVTYLPKEIDSSVLNALSTPAGGEVIPPESQP